MAEKLTKEKIYADLILFHAYNWMQNYQMLNVTRYLETQAGAILGIFINEKGAETVIHDLQVRIDQMMS